MVFTNAGPSQKTMVLVIAVVFSSVASFNIAKSQVITFPPAGMAVGFWLNSTKFQDFSTIAQPPGLVDLGNCGPLSFGGRFQVPGTFSRHTFTVSLKRDGATIVTESTKLGPLSGTKLVELNFPAQDFSPGEWKIEWVFLTSPTHTDSGTIKLVAPILKSLNPPYVEAGVDQLYCGGFGYTNKLCLYRQKPSTGFIFNNSYYMAAANITSSCPAGQVSGTLCLMATAPSAGFVHNNSLYFRPPGSIGHGFPRNQPPFTLGGACPPEIQVGNNPHSIVVRDSWGCLVMPAPFWQNAVVQGNLLFLTQRKAGTCLDGSFDGANCFIRSPPAGSKALESLGNWYWTPHYCN